MAVPLAQNQFDALVDWTFNIGVEALERSTLLRVLNQGRYDYAANQFLAWDHVGGQVEEAIGSIPIRSTNYLLTIYY